MDFKHNNNSFIGGGATWTTNNNTNVGGEQDYDEVQIISDNDEDNGVVL